MENLSVLYHWNTSMQFGGDIVDRDKISKFKINRNTIENENTLKLEEYNIDFLKKRRTIREFNEGSTLSFKELSTLLNNSIRQEIILKDIKCPSPSAGALYPIDTYILVNNSEGINTGIYFYNPLEHSLIYYKKIEEHKLWENAFLNQSFTNQEKYCISIIFMLDIDAISCKYGERGYRYALLEAGHISQNLQLISSDLNLLSVPVGGYIDSEINELLELSYDKYLPLYAVFIGK